MTLRPAGVVLLLAGLTAGTLSDPSTHRAPIATGHGTLLRADFHVHAFPGDGVLPAWELRNEANRRGLDVIAITNHNQMLAARLPAGESGVLPLVIRGQEVTSPSFHLIALGVREVVDWRLPLAAVIDAVHSQGGVAIAAHPIGKSWRAGVSEAATTLDGSEALHSLSAADPAGANQLLEFHRTVRAKNPTLAAIGSSDFHSAAPIGRCSTYVLVDEVSERGVLSAIRRGQTAATDASGTLIGPTQLVDLIRESRPSRPSAEPFPTLSTFSVTLVVGALVLLICVR